MMAATHFILNQPTRIQINQADTCQRLRPARTVPSRQRDNKGDLNMPLISDTATVQARLASLPVANYGAGESVFTEGTRTGRLLILRNGAVSVVRGGAEIARVTEPGAIFGELSFLLDQPHTADVRTLEASEFHVTDAAALLTQDPVALLYVTTVLARRLDGANRAVIELRNHIQTDQPLSVIGKTVERIEVLLSASGASLVYAGYPTDPFA
jgi:CRP-like cAMP-binding protein